MHEDTVHLVGQRALHDVVRLERVERVAEGHRDALDLLARLHRLVDVPLLRLARVELALDPVAIASISAAMARYGFTAESTERYSKRPGEETRSAVVRFW